MCGRVVCVCGRVVGLCEGAEGGDGAFSDARLVVWLRWRMRNLR